MVVALVSCSAPAADGTAQPPSGHGVPSDHVHGVAFNRADDKVYLATHDGLFRYDDTGPVRVGPVIDLMGFTAAGPDHFYSSGHPGPGVDMANPVGLIESTDAGETREQSAKHPKPSPHEPGSTASSKSSLSSRAPYYGPTTADRPSATNRHGEWQLRRPETDVGTPRPPSTRRS
ncbi:hypothetical protein Q9R32_17250, partial [Actinotalea sp. AC32]|nr:hypothetical protein [Actinotalea sp. AC32]